MKILIKVTKDVLRRSSACIGEANQNCAIALAVRLLAPKAEIYVSHINWLGVDCSDQPCEWDQISSFSKLPAEAIRFISTFDSSSIEQRIAMSELYFEVDLPSEVIDQIGISEAYRILSESKTLELVMPK